MTSFKDLLNGSIPENTNIEGSVVKGRVISINNDFVVIDVGLKSEGRIAVREFQDLEGKLSVAIGDVVDVFVERIEDRNGDAVLSRDKARQEESWSVLEAKHLAGEPVIGKIYNRVKGGFTVNIDGVIAFLPGSQVDVRQSRETPNLLNTAQSLMILKMDKIRGNVVVSRRAVLEETRAKNITEMQEKLIEGSIVEGTVKNLTDYGAFIDLGAIDGLLHVTDISWKRLNHPSDALKVGQVVKVQITKFDKEQNRISLSMRVLENDPWEIIAEKYVKNSVVKGTVSNVTDYGAFIELEPGVEGLVHVSEISWTKKNIHPGKIISTSQVIDVMVLDIDYARRRISLGIKQCVANPWNKFKDTYPVGTIMDGIVKNSTEYGIFIGLDGDIDGMVHASDISWEVSGEAAIKLYQKGQTIQVKILDIDADKERIGLGIKQLSGGGANSDMLDNIKKGQVVTCTIDAIVEGGIEVTTTDGVKGFISRSNLSKDRTEQRGDRFAVGEKVDAKVTNINKKTNKLALSIKAHEQEEESQAMATYGSSDSGASLGDILGAALQKKKES